MSLTFSDRESLWISGGGNPAFAAFAAAISMAENAEGTLGANPDTGCSCGGSCYSFGPWQINCENIPGLIQQGIISSANDLTDPIKNAAAAVSLSGNGANWNPWSTFKSGAFLQYLPGGLGVIGSAANVANAASQGYEEGQGGANVPSWATSVGSTVLVATAAVVLLLIGGIWLAVGTETGRNVTSTVAKTAEVAAA